MGFKEAFRNIEKRASGAIKQEDGDYLSDDGLLMCGKCHTPKQVRVEVFGETRTPMCLCQCAKAHLEAETEERQRQERQEKIRSLRRLGFPDVEMSRWTFADDDNSNKRVSEIARRYAENFREMEDRGKGLLLYGTVGTGKTFAAACIANALIDKGVPALVTNFARLTNTIGGMYEGKQQYIDGLSRFDLLVIDDLASERDTEYMNEIVFQIIDSRYRSGLPLIVTTNLTAEEIKHPAEVKRQRIFSRLLEMCIPVEVKGADRRKEALKTDFNELKDLLGL